MISRTTAARVLMDDENRVRGVETDTGETISARVVILAAGAIASPLLLMRSGVGPSDHLADHGIACVIDLPGVGENLQDHPNVILNWSQDTSRGRSDAAQRTREGLAGTASGLRVRATTKGSKIPDDCMIRAFGSAAMEGAHGGIGVRMAVALTRTTSLGSVRLGSAGVAAAPDIDLNFLSTADDLERMRNAVRLALDLSERPAIRSYLASRLNPPTDLDDEAFDAWLRSVVAPGHHLAGTCAMGPDPKAGAVVDQRGRVHGAQGLYVADAAIMPNVTRPNTQNTIMMIGERIADLVQRQEM